MEGCLEAWKEVGLTALRSTLDEQALDIAQRRELSTKRRKELAHTTRAFKKAPEQERAQGMNAILKAYQEEIDSLTKRAKASEAAFTGLYAKVREAPDPVAPLQAAVEIEPETVSLREQNDAMQSDLLRLRLDLKDYEQETAGIKNQDAVIRQLRDKIVTLEKQYEEDMNDMYRAEQDQREKQENDELRLQLQGSKIEAQSLRAQLGVATASAAEARQAHDASEADLLDKDSQVGALERAKEAETEFVEGELRRARATIAGLEQELGHLRSRGSEGAAAATAAPGMPADSKAETQLIVAAKDREIGRLAGMLRQAQVDDAAAREHLSQEAGAASEQLQRATAEITSLQEQLSQLPSREAYEGLRGQLRMIRRAEGAVEGDMDKEDQDDVAGTAELLLARKVRHLSQKIAALNGSLLEKDALLEQARAGHEALQAAEARDLTSRALISKLEADLATASSAASAHVRMEEHGQASRESAPLLRAIMPPAETAESGSHGRPSSPRGHLDGSAGTSLLPVVTAQRDRLKSQVLALEEQLHSAQQDAARGRSKLEAMSKELAVKHRYGAPNPYGPTVHGTAGVPAYEDAGSRPRASSSSSSSSAAAHYHRLEKLSDEDTSAILGALDRFARFAIGLVSQNLMARRTTILYMLLLHLLVWGTIHRLQSCVVAQSALRLELDEGGAEDPFDRFG